MSSFLRGLWYFALHARDLKPGAMTRKIMLGEPVLIGRTRAGEVFALRDVCPHRAVPLSAGRLEGGEVECPYHGWRFRTDGQCSAIPSLVEGQDMDVAKIRVRSYSAAERNGLVWVHFADGGVAEPPPDLPVPESARPTLIEQQTFSCGIDAAVIGLMDPAHGPFVHTSWFWRDRASIHAKAKAYGPNPRGFTMLAHAPSKNAGLYKVLGGRPTTEIAFHLPSVRIENIRIGERFVVGLTTCTPVTENETQVTQTFFWNMPWLSLIKPLMRPIARAFMGQDRDIVNLQASCAPYDPTFLWIRDADVPAMWYQRLKKEWAESRAAARPFDNPVQPVTLRWRS